MTNFFNKLNHTVALNTSFKAALNSLVAKSINTSQIFYYSTDSIKNQEALVKYNNILKGLTP